MGTDGHIFKSKIKSMNISKSQRFFMPLIVFLSSVICSCSSVQLAYNQTDLLLKWWIDDYIDLSSDQENLYEQAIPVLIKKHRQEELPKALQKLRLLKTKLDQPLRIEDGVMVVKDIKSFSRDSMNLLLDDAVTLALTLDPKQITYLENAFIKSNRKFQSDYLKGTPEEQFDKRFEKIIERTESICGDLSKTQKSQIREIAKEYLLDMTTVYQSRLHKQQLSIKILKKIVLDKPSSSQAKLMLGQLLNDIEFGSNEEQKEFEKKRDMNNGSVIAKISELLDDKQRKKTQAKIQNWENDIKVLIQYKAKS